MFFCLISHVVHIELNMLPAWLNNCVGHFNHRYFLSFCLYMTLGCIYCSSSSKELFLEAYSAIEVRPEEFSCCTIMSIHKNDHQYLGVEFFFNL